MPNWSREASRKLGDSKLSAEEREEISRDFPTEIFAPAFAGLILSWTIIPRAALLLGIVPFLRKSDRQRLA